MSREDTRGGAWVNCLYPLHLPQLNTSIEAATGQQAPIRTPGQCIDRAALTGERLEVLTRGDIPESDSGIISATGECTAIRSKDEMMDAAGMLPQPEQGTVLQVPQLDGPIPTPSLPDSFGATMHRAACRGAWHPQGPHRSTLPPRATTGRGTAPPPGDGPTGVRAGMDNM